jgi:hypothetical protein
VVTTVVVTSWSTEKRTEGEVQSKGEGRRQHDRAHQGRGKAMMVAAALWSLEVDER